MSRRVYITGLGAVTPFGYGFEPLWKGLLAGESRLAPITAFDATAFPATIAGEARDFQIKDHVPKSYRKAVKVMARDIELAVGAAKAAVESAGLTTAGTNPDADPTYPPERTGCNIGAGLIATDINELTAAFVTALDEHGRFSYERWGGMETTTSPTGDAAEHDSPAAGPAPGDGGINNLTPLWLLKYLPNMLACHVTIIHQARGPSNTITCAEASGLLSIAESVRVIERGDADLCYAGGAESKIEPMGVLRWTLLSRLANTRSLSDPVNQARTVVRPYDPDAPGAVLGEGGGIVTLEAAETAEARGATLLAEVIGVGAGMSPESPDAGVRAQGLIAAIRAALRNARLTPDDIDLIVPHAAGIPDSDAEEAAAFNALFAGRLATIPIVPITPATGDMTAGHAGVLACVAAKILVSGQLPARIHHGTPIPGLLVGPAPAGQTDAKVALVCTNAVGGQNAALILRAVR
ncbi:MAG: beta-ketoacyl-[acyl-carrier-protein] synthase family protein [Phycisphaerales bacterium]